MSCGGDYYLCGESRRAELCWSEGPSRRTEACRHVKYADHFLVFLPSRDVDLLNMGRKHWNISMIYQSNIIYYIILNMLRVEGWPPPRRSLSDPSVTPQWQLSDPPSFDWITLLCWNDFYIGNAKNLTDPREISDMQTNPFK